MAHSKLGDSLQLSRRGLFHSVPFLSAGLTLGAQTPGIAAQTAQAAGKDGLKPLNRFPRMVQEYFVHRVRHLSHRRLERLAALQTRADAEAYVRSVRAKIRISFGPSPEKTPLNARVTGVVERDEYKIEKVIFESRPGFLVTANLYIPRGRRFPLPGVVGACGHSNNGKAASAYQSFSQGLARMGYVVLIYDPIGQGERLQYVDENWKPLRGIGVREHLYAGNQQFLVEEFFGAWRAWDGIRALDYLLSREEVDPKHVGVTGNSGGGTMTTWLCGVERRWTMAAPSCFVTEFRRNLENELPADTEQCPPKVLALGLEHEDFIAAMAPKPVILLGKEKDFFDVRGTEAAYRRLKRLYGLLGAGDNIAFYAGSAYHGYSQDNREAMYRWFNRVTGISDAKKEPKIVIEKDETLWCTPHGQVAELKSRPIYLFTREKSKALARKRLDLEGDGLVQVVAASLKMPRSRGVPEYRILRPRDNRRYPLPHAAIYMVATEPGIHAVVYRLSKDPLYSRPPRDRKPAILYVPNLSSDAELRDEPLIADLMQAEPDAAVFTCDVRGCGESQPDTTDKNSFFQIYGSDYFYATHSIMLDYPYVAQRSYDILRVLDWMSAQGHTGIHLAAKGRGTIPAVFAALLSAHVTSVTLKNAPTSYSEIAEATNYNWPLSALLAGVLKDFDLPDCYRELKKKNLRLVEPWGANPQSDTQGLA